MSVVVDIAGRLAWACLIVWLGVSVHSVAFLFLPFMLMPYHIEPDTDDAERFGNGDMEPFA